MQLDAQFLMRLRPFDSLQAVEPGLTALGLTRALSGFVLANELFGAGDERLYLGQRRPQLGLVRGRPAAARR